MGGKFRAIIQVSCVLLLALSLSLVTAVPVTAVQFPSISPTTAQYDLDDPAEVITTVTWGIATNIVAIADDVGNLTAGLGNDYMVLIDHLIILDTYLKNKLTDIGESVVLIIKFDTGAAALNITATGTQPSISPTTAQYNLDSPADAKTTITWGTATSVVSIVDGDKYALVKNVNYTVAPINAATATLTILHDPYLKGNLTDIGDKVVLTIDFNVGANVTFTITATGTQPSISPTTGQYNIDSPANVTTTVTWGTATSVVSIVDGDKYTLAAGTNYNVTDTVPGVSATLTILSSPYLAGKLTDIGDKVVLTIDFNLGANVTFTITANGTQPSISPTTATHDISVGGAVTTNITWGSATSVVSIVDNDMYTLAAGTDYTVTNTVPGVSGKLTILGSYLKDKLGITEQNPVIVLTIDFDVGRDATLTINRASICFIATAAYGTPMAQEVQILRDFRDQYLLTNPLGQAFVDFYYRVSPPIAEFITEHPSLKLIVRVGLMPTVAMCNIVVNTTPAEKMAIVGLLVLVIVALAVRVMRRRGRGPEYI